MPDVNIKYNSDGGAGRLTPEEMAAYLQNNDGLWVRFRDADGNTVKPFEKGSFLNLFENDFCLMELPADEMTTLDRFESFTNYHGLQLGEIRKLARLLNKANPPV